MNALQLSNAQFLPHVCQLVDEGHTVTIRAKGNSMRPFVESDRDAAVLAKAQAFSEGDVVLAETAPGHYVLHRIDRIRQPDGTRVRRNCAMPDARLTLRGDGNPYGTEHCRLSHLRARVCAFERKGKLWSTDSVAWRCYSSLWRWLLPVRRPLLALYRLLWLHQWPQRWKLRKITKQQQ